MEPGPEFDGKLDARPVTKKGDRLANIVHYDLARITVRHVLFEFLADRRIDRSFDVFIHLPQQIFTFHALTYWSRDGAKSYN